MTIEKAFAIAAEPMDIWQALWQELGHGDPEAFKLENSNWPHSLSLNLNLAGLRSRISYKIEPKPDYSEVTVFLEPLGLRYPLMQILTLGRMKTSLELLLVQGLANLKESLEGPYEDDPTPEAEA